MGFIRAGEMPDAPLIPWFVCDILARSSFAASAGLRCAIASRALSATSDEAGCAVRVDSRRVVNPASRVKGRIGSVVLIPG